jgi:hypothetical protein
MVSKVGRDPEQGEGRVDIFLAHSLPQKAPDRFRPTRPASLRTNRQRPVRDRGLELVVQIIRLVPDRRAAPDPLRTLAPECCAG